MHKFIVKTAVLLCSAAILSVANAGPLYTVTDLGLLPGDRSSEAYGINNNDAVVGVSIGATTNVRYKNQHATVYSGGNVTNLGAFGSGYSQARGINDSGQIVGSASYTATGSSRAFLYSQGQMTDLGTLTKWGQSYLGSSNAYAINSSGQVVGSATSYNNYINGQNHAFVYGAGVMTDLGTLGGTYSSALNLNDRGQIVGFSGTNSGSEAAFIYTNGVMTSLGSLGGDTSRTWGINTIGQVVGFSTTSGGRGHAFLYSEGVMTDLGTLNGYYSTALDINDDGQIVGTIDTIGQNNMVPKGFIYKDGTMSDLNDLIDPLSGWSISGAFGINEDGDISATGYNPNVGSRALLLRYVAPTDFSVPEPSSLPLLGIALGWLALTKRKLAHC